MGHGLLKDKLSILMGGDLLLSLLAIFAAFILRFGPYAAIQALLSKPVLNLLTVVLVIAMVSLLLDVYDYSQHNNKVLLLINTILTASCSFTVLSMLYYVAPGLIVGRGLLLLLLAIFAIAQFSWHLLFFGVFKNPVMAKKVLIVGNNSVASKIGDILVSTDFTLTHRLIGYFAHGDEPSPAFANKGVIRYQSDKGDDLYVIALKNKVSQIVVTTWLNDEDSLLLQSLLSCKLVGIEIFDGQTFYEKMTGKLMLENTGNNWLLFSTGFKSTLVITTAKRIVDVIASLCGLLMVLPFLPLIAVLVKLNSSGPLLYSQERVGQGGKGFRLYKFRTMPVDAEDDSGAVWSQHNDERIRPIGRFLRKCRVDEIPQLYNILIGEMSLVGPRPERPEFVESLSRIIPHYAKRHFIKPGLTGWAQVRYPYGSSVEDAYEKLRFDLYYFKNMSPILDTIIFLKTFKVVLFGFGGR